MKEYPLQYANTDKNKKSHYNWKQFQVFFFSQDSEVWIQGISTL